ncbi:MAG TPA: hypothetical protein VGI13_11540 [Candidatus Acidoferrum sp.]
MKAMVTGKATGPEQMRWNFGDSRERFLSLDEFLEQKEADGVEFFTGKEPWLKGISKLSWQTFLRVCTEEMNDLSMRTVKLVIEYCLEVLEEATKKIPGKVSIARLEAALNARYADQVENKVYQYRWALRHPVVKDAITKALANRFPAR